MARIGQVRYECEITDTEDLESAALKAGWAGHDSDIGPLDYVEPSDFETFETARSLKEAERKAALLIDRDYWGIVRIRRSRYRQDRICPGIVEWKREHSWEWSPGDGLRDCGADEQDDEE